MFAPPGPLPDSRRASATEHHLPHHPQHSAYDLAHSPMLQNPHLQRSNSYSWNPDLGMPPPPSEIDALGDSLNHALLPLSRPASRSQSVSPTSRVPSRYDPEVEGLEGSAEQRDRTQDHMNMVTKHPKVKIDVILSSTLFEAGGAISGKVELTCTTGQRLRLGHIAIELEAVEQLTSRDHAATQLFLYNRTLFQGEKLPPSNAVLPAAPINGYWTARKGRTSFPFSFRLPSSAPSCVKFAGNASLRYGLKATVQTWYNEDKMVVTARREAFVLEKWADQLHPRFREPAEAVGDTRLFMGGNGAVWLEAGVAEQLFWGGGQMLIRCGIKNSTKRHLSGIKVALARRLIFPVGSAEGFHDSPDKLSLEPRITEIVHEQTFKGREYEFDPNAESVCTVAVDVPRDLRTIRKTRLFEVRTFAFVSLLLGSFAKDLTIEIPVYVAHTASGQPPARQTLDDLHAGPPSHSVPQRPSSSIGHGHAAPPQHHQQHQQHHGQHAHHPHHGSHGQGLATNMAAGMVEVQRLAAERGWSPAPVLPGSGHLADSARPASTAPGMIQLPSQAQPFMVSPDGHLQWNPAETSWNASRLVSPPATTGHSIQRSVSAAPDVVQNVAPPQPFAAILDPTAQWAASQRAMSASPGPMAFAPPTTNFVPAAAAPPQTYGVPFPQGPLAPSNDRRASLPVAGPYGGALPQQAAYQHAPQEVLPPMPEPQSIIHSGRNAQQYSAPPLQPPMPPFAGGGGAPSITGLATIEEDSESQAGTIKTLAKLPTIGKTGTKGGKGNSVSRNNIEQFEAMAEAEEDEEEVKRQMIAMGMQPDEDAFASKEQGRSSDARAEASDSTPKASTSRRADGTQASSSGTYRLKASDIFQHAGSADVPSNQRAEPAHKTVASAEVTAAELGHSQDSYDSMQSNQARERRSSTAGSVVSLRRSSSSQGIGLQALESNLVRTTTPKISTNTRPIVTMANVARAESTSSPLASAPAVFDDSTRSRKNSALRAAALAREEAERKSAEEQARAAEERARQVQAEQARQAAAAEEEAARKQAARIRAEEQQRLERERIAEHARRQRELREQEEEQRLKAEAERIAREEEAERQKREELERQERQERQAAEAARARAVADDTKELRRLAYAASDRMERIKAAIANAPKPIGPSVLTKTTKPVSASPSKTSDQDRVVLQQQAVQRVDGWLSNPASPNASHLNTPGTPSVSVLSVMRKEEPTAKAAGTDDGRSSYAYRSPSQVINPMWEGEPSRSEKVEVAMPKSHTMADLASSKASAAATPARTSVDEPVPQLSAELRALVDGSDIRPARKSGTALKEHPISRRLSGLGSTEKASAVVVPSPSFTHVSSQADRDRLTSKPSWPRPGLPSGSEASAVPFVAPARSGPGSNTERRASRNHESLEVGIPTRVEKTLMAPNFDSQRSKDEHSYDIRSARGGRGGRVTSVAQLWSKIAGDDDDAASDVSRNSLAAPHADGEPRSASPSNTSTFRPKPRRSSSASNSAPALDFSQKAMSSPTTSTGVTAIAATFAGGVHPNKPESLKSLTAAQFLNTSVPKAVFATSTDPASKPEKRPLPKPVLQPGAVPAPQLVRPTAMRAQKPERTSSRRISTQLLSTFEKDPGAQREMSVEEMMSKVAVDSTILGALNYDGSHDVSTWRCDNGTEIKMSGRGTTKAIGETKLKSLRAVWGS